MKRISLFFTILIITLCSTISWADNDRVIQINQLPVNAQKLIKHHFAGLKPSVIKEDTDWFDKSYSVHFSNGTKIEFNKNGEWKEIDCKKSYVPQGLIPSKIASYLKANYPEAKVLEIEIDDDSRKYDVKLNNRLTLEFNKNQDLIGFDD